MEAKDARLVVTPHPLTTQGQTSVAVVMEGGESLLCVLERHGIDGDWVVELNGLQVPMMMWERTRVKHGVVIECRRLVHGGGTLRLVAFAALAWATMGGGNTALMAMAETTATSFSGFAVGFAAFAVGSMVLNRVLPPPRASSMDLSSNNAEPTYSLSGGRNSARLWQPIGLVLGQPYCVPDLAAQSYTYFSGEDQFLIQSFNGGLNVQAINAVRLGQTSLDTYQDVTVYTKGLPTPLASSALKVVNGSLPSTNVDSIAGGLLDAPNGTGAWTVRTTSVGTVSIGIDFEFGLFGINASNGAYEARTVMLDVQYAVAGSGAWQAVPVSDVANGYTNATAKPLRVGVTFGVPSGQYDVRVRKVTKNLAGSNEQNTATWSQLKSFQADTASYTSQAVVSLQIKASGQLNGSIEDLNWIATARTMPIWTGSTWATATNRSNGLSNPGAQILLLCRGIYNSAGQLVAGLGLSDSRIDIEALKAFMVWCTAKGFTFDAYIQDAISNDDLLNAIAYAGLGSISRDAGKYGVCWTEDAAPIEGVINMGNIKARSFSVSYATASRADEIEYGYFDRNNGNAWNSLRVLAPGVTVPTSTARLSCTGITSEAHAATLARYAMAQNIYMAKAITFDQDLEFLTYKRGTVLALSHDMTQWGYSGRIQSAALVGSSVVLTLDDTIPATSPSGAVSRYIGLRLAGEVQFRVFPVAAFSGTTRTVTLVGAWPTGVALPGATGNAMDALWVYDFTATPGLKVVVSKIEPADSQGGARVTVVPLPDEFWPFVLSGAYTPPINRSLLQAAPTASNVQVYEQLNRQGNTFAVDLSIAFDVSGAFDSAEVWGAVNGGKLQMLGATKDRSFLWAGGLGETWSIQVRPKNGLGNVGTVASTTYAVVGLTLPPSNVLGLSMAVEASGVRVTWSDCPDIDYAETVIRVGSAWDTATEVARKSATSHLLGWPSIGIVKVWAKHVDTTGNVSAVAQSATITLTAPAAVTGLALTASTTGLQASWTMPAVTATSLPFDRVELSWSSNFATVVEAKKATTATFPWTTPGLKELFVRVVDVAGNTGAAASVVLTVLAPSAPTSLNMSVTTSGVVANWTPPSVGTAQQPLAGVELSWTADFSALIETKSATSVQLGWLISGTYRLYARYADAAGNKGTVASSKLTVAAPSAPTSLSMAVSTSGVNANWMPPAVGSDQQMLAGVELSWTADFSALIETKSATSVQLGWLISGTYRLYARYTDIAGNKGAVASSMLTVNPPSVVTGLALSSSTIGLQASWVMPAATATSLPVDRVELSWSSNFASVIEAKKATTATFVFTTPGLKELFVRVVDVAGNVGATAATSLTVRAPSAPSALAVTIGSSGVSAAWNAPSVASDQQSLNGVQLSWMANFSSLIETRSATSVQLGWLVAGSYTLYARYVDAAGNTGASSSVVFTVAVPDAPASLAIAFGTSNIEAKWTAPSVGATQQALDRIELSWGSAFTTIIDGKKATTTTFGWMTAGSYTLYARYVDMAGNIGAVSQATLQVLPPSQPSMTSVETQINAVTLRWQDAKTVQPIRKYAIWYGEAGTLIANATLYGSAGADSRSDILFYRSSGNKVAYLVAEDVAGNQSQPRQIDLQITMPNNFVLASEYYEDWQSVELTNATIVNGATGQIILPAVDGRTWGQRLSNSGWTTAQQKIDAGYPIVVQPVPASGKHVEQHDLGKLLATGIVRVTPTIQSSVAGYTAAIRIRGSNGDTNTAWQPWLTGDSASISAFRYIEVEYSVASDGKGFVVLDDLYVKVEISEVTESATLALNAGDTAGTAYVCTKPFLDVRTAQATALGSPNISRINCIVDDTTLPAKVFVQAWDTSNTRTSGTVSLYISGV